MEREREEGWVRGCLYMFLSHFRFSEQRESVFIDVW